VFFPEFGNSNHPAASNSSTIQSLVDRGIFQPSMNNDGYEQTTQQTTIKTRVNRNPGNHPGNNAPVGDYGAGYLEISEKGFGFLRTAAAHFHPKPTDIFVTPDTIKRSFLREGSLVEGPTQPPHRGTSPQLALVDKVNGMPSRNTPKRCASRTSRALIRSRNTISKPRLI
jgi:transcription termination factor Rho